MNALTPEDILRKVGDLPALPAVVAELIQALGNSETNAEQLAEKISHDQAIAAKTLRLANSSFYGLPRQVTSISEAAAILGFRTLRSIAMAAGLVGAFSHTNCPGFEFRGFWRHAIGTALLARALAQAARLDADSAFTLGLLHDIGRLVLVSVLGDQYAKVIEYQHAQDCLPLEAERHVLGLDHAKVGSLVAERWHFSPEMALAIENHHAPAGASSKCLADVVHVADNIAHALDLSHMPADMVPPLAMDAWTRLALDDAVYVEVFTSVESQHDMVCQTLLG